MNGSMEWMNERSMWEMTKIGGIVGYDLDGPKKFNFQGVEKIQ